VSRHEYRYVVEELIDRLPGVQAFQWIPVVPAAARGSVEAQARAEGLDNFQFTEPDPAAPGRLLAPANVTSLPRISPSRWCPTSRCWATNLLGGPLAPFLAQAAAGRQGRGDAQAQPAAGRGRPPGGRRPAGGVVDPRKPAGTRAERRRCSGAM
jgi:hypothetical protein